MLLNTEVHQMDALRDERNDTDSKSTSISATKQQHLMNLTQSDAPRQELELYFKLVACHASNLSHLLSQRALKIEHLQLECDYFAWRMRSFSRKSLAVYQVIQTQLRRVPLLEEPDKCLYTSATRCLKDCIVKLRAFDSFCLAVPHQPGMDQISWSMVQYESTSRDVITSAGATPLRDLVNSVEMDIRDAMEIALKAGREVWRNRLKRFFLA
jgi:hypothetical protein